MSNLPLPQPTTPQTQPLQEPQPFPLQPLQVPVPLQVQIPWLQVLLAFPLPLGPPQQDPQQVALALQVPLPPALAGLQQGLQVPLALQEPAQVAGGERSGVAVTTPELGLLTCKPNKALAGPTRTPIRTRCIYGPEHTNNERKIL